MPSTHIPLLFPVLYTLISSPPILSLYFALNSAQMQTVTQREKGYPEAIACLRKITSPSILSEYIAHAFPSRQVTFSSAKQETKKKKKRKTHITNQNKPLGFWKTRDSFKGTG